MSEIYFDETARRWRDSDTQLFHKAPECCQCGEALRPGKVWDPLEGGCLSDDDSLDYDPPDGWRLLCEECYREEYGCEYCSWDGGERFCNGVCTGDEVMADAERRSAELAKQVL